jgi:hypothetical protein
VDVYWSIERCGWVPCRGPADPVATTWPLEAEPEVATIPELPQQRSDAKAPADR